MANEASVSDKAAAKAKAKEDAAAKKAALKQKAEDKAAAKAKAQAEFGAQDCCNRNSAGENHAPGCKVGDKLPEAPKGPLSKEQIAINESRKALDNPLPAGQQFFESPEGYIILAEEGKPHVFCRQANGGKGMWINPRR